MTDMFTEYVVMTVGLDAKSITEVVIQLSTRHYYSPKTVGRIKKNSVRSSGLIARF